MTKNSNVYAVPKRSFEEAVRLYLSECRFRNLSPETIRKYRFSLKKVQDVLENHQLELLHLTTQDLSHRLIADLLEQGLSVRTVNCTIIILKELFKFLISERWFPINIAADLKLFKLEQKLVHTFFCCLVSM